MWSSGWSISFSPTQPHTHTHTHKTCCLKLLVIRKVTNAERGCLPIFFRWYYYFENILYYKIHNVCVCVCVHVHTHTLYIVVYKYVMVLWWRENSSILYSMYVVSLSSFLFVNPTWILIDFSLKKKKIPQPVVLCLEISPWT